MSVWSVNRIACWSPKTKSASRNILVPTLCSFVVPSSGGSMLEAAGTGGSCKWGPHRGEFTFTRWSTEVREWVSVTKTTQENRGTALYSQLQGTAKKKIETWLDNDENKRTRRDQRIQRGNRKYRIQQFEIKLTKQREEQIIRTQAQMEVEFSVWGQVQRRGAPPTASREQQDDDDDEFEDYEEEPEVPFFQGGAGAIAAASASASAEAAEAQGEQQQDDQQIEREEPAEAQGDGFASPAAAGTA